MVSTIEWLRHLGNEGALRNATDAVEGARRATQDVESSLQRIAHPAARPRVDVGGPGPSDTARRVRGATVSTAETNRDAHERDGAVLATSAAGP